MMDYTLELGVRVNVFFLGLVLSEDFVREEEKEGSRCKEEPGL